MDRGCPRRSLGGSGCWRRRWRLEQRAEEQAAEKERKKKSKNGGGPKKPGLSKPVSKDSDQINLTDPESALMRKGRSEGYQQAYNAQAVVDADGSQLILGTGVIRTPSDANQLKPALESVPEAPERSNGCWATGGT